MQQRPTHKDTSRHTRHQAPSISHHTETMVGKENKTKTKWNETNKKKKKKILLQFIDVNQCVALYTIIYKYIYICSVFVTVGDVANSLLVKVIPSTLTPTYWYKNFAHTRENLPHLFSLEEEHACDAVSLLCEFQFHWTGPAQNVPNETLLAAADIVCISVKPLLAEAFSLLFVFFSTVRRFFIGAG